jgi:SAM-dependent methyltransferase
MLTAEPAGAFLETACAICGPGVPAGELYPASFTAEDLNPAVFSARRLPDRVHYRMVRCDRCGLVRSDPVADAETLAALYRESSFDYGLEVENLKRTYGRYLAGLDRLGARHGSLLEIGCGNGFFLDVALKAGYTEVRGVEPSAAAVEQASPETRGAIAQEMFRPGLFAPASFDVACLFQVFDHVPDPRELLAGVHDVLRPGGLLLCLNHDVESLSARLLKDRSPIIDIEHTYLYSRATLGWMLELEGFEVAASGGVRNTYSLAYLAQLLPLPGTLKLTLLSLLRASRAGRLRASVPLGNLYVVGRRR